MERPLALQHNEQFVSDLQDCAKLLVERLQNNDYQDASQLIHSLVEVRDRHIFNAVGKLTRALHDAIVNFNVDGDFSSEPVNINSSEIRDASERLNYVIEMTQTAADRTMDRVEASAPIAMNLGQEARTLRDEWSRLKRREMTAAEFRELYGRMDDFLEQMGNGAEQLSTNLQDIILEQGYQDLTGQLLKKVIGLVTDVESELVNLMRIAGQVEEVTGLTADAGKEKRKKADSNQGEGPQMHAHKRTDVVSGQDDVDDLLSSLGF
jgi:chemotaxis protein CheZ